MIALILKRVLLAIPVLLVVASLTFVLVRIVPGGPFDADKNLPPEIIANLNAKYHLDKPVPEQYFLYLGRLAQGDLGVSYKYVNRTVNDILSDAFPVSLQLGTISLTLAVMIGVPLGAIAAVCRGRREDVIAMFLSTLGISVPGFVIGATLIFVFAIELRVLPVGLWESPWHVVLPAVTLAFSPAAYLARLTRASVLEIVEKDWVRTARSKGLSQWSTVTKHILRNSLIPVVTVLGPLTAIVITGSFVVEYIYAIPGMGRFFITAVMNRDYDLILGTTLVFAVLLIVANTFVDVAYQILDPRMRLED
ncbi:MAG: transporter permease [Cyanobacteriota bacterium erpe_2018_sw_21hr_WHONDRS-SW48-000092_B_bin.40]|jgi:oligopeptide transport system permease protein|nr:transporter permease [Cyanobacteriota bacterium erpe_2018_sw_21hr_WHONDRS-SW48-000092_B_bin.40]